MGDHLRKRRLDLHLRKRRLDLHLRQRDVAALLGVDPLTVTNWELGHTKPLATLRPAIVTFLGYDPTSPIPATGQPPSAQHVRT
jgi:transcriptional regulator with XRE-family HTH domain